MKAVILAGGEATRLRPLTYNLPKAMVPVLNVPFLEWVILHLRQHGVKDIIIAQGYLPEPIHNYFKDGNRLGVRISYVKEDAPLGTAGAIKNAAEHIDDTFLVLNGDIFHDFDISAMIAFHKKANAKVTISLTPVEDPTHYGLIETDSDHRITHFLEKPTQDQVTTDMINAGIYVLEPEVLDLIPPQTKVSIERETFQKLLHDGERVFAYPCRGYWMDTGTPDKYLQLHRDLFDRKSTIYTPSGGKKVSIGRKCVIDKSANMNGHIVIGDNCSIEAGVNIIGPVVIGAGCTILSESLIEDSVIWNNVCVEQKVRIQHSIVASNCRLGSESSLHSCIIGENVTIISGSTLKPDTRILPGATYPENQPH